MLWTLIPLGFLLIVVVTMIILWPKGAKPDPKASAQNETAAPVRLDRLRIVAAALSNRQGVAKYLNVANFLSAGATPERISFLRNPAIYERLDQVAELIEIEWLDLVAGDDPLFVYRFHKLPESPLLESATLEEKIGDFQIYDTDNVGYFVKISPITFVVSNSKETLKRFMNNYIVGNTTAVQAQFPLMHSCDYFKLAEKFLPQEPFCICASIVGQDLSVTMKLISFEKTEPNHLAGVFFDNISHEDLSIRFSSVRIEDDFAHTEVENFFRNAAKSKPFDPDPMNPLEFAPMPEN
jgi:hypothetical protein